MTTKQMSICAPKVIRFISSPSASHGYLAYITTTEDLSLIHIFGALLEPRAQVLERAARCIHLDFATALRSHRAAVTALAVLVRRDLLEVIAAERHVDQSA